MAPVYLQFKQSKPEKLISRRCSQTAFPWPHCRVAPACCDKDAQIVPGEVHRIQQFSAAGWLLSLCEKGEQFLVVKLATFDYASYFLKLLTVALTCFTSSAKVQVSQFLFICQLFHSLCQSAWACMGYHCPLPLFVPLTPRVGCLLRLFGELFLFSAYSWFLFLAGFSVPLPVTFFLSASKEHWLNKDKRSNQLKTFLLKRSSMPLQMQDQIKESRELQIRALPSPFSKLHRLHFPSSTDPIFQAPPSPFSKLHRPHFPGSTILIFQARPSAFSKLHRPYFPSSAVSIFNL